MIRPRLHWVCPLPPAETDIAHYTRRILPELTERADVTLWTDARGWDAELERFCPVRHLEPAHVVPRMMQTPGAGPDRPGTLFIHIGNAWVFHADLLALTRRMPSVVILHDLNIQEMLFDAMWNDRLDSGLYRQVMRAWYGAGIDEKIDAVFAGRQTPGQLGHDHPGFELATGHAVAVLTHTRGTFETVSRRGHVPVYRLDLPFRTTGTAGVTDTAGPTGAATARRAESGPLRLLQFGYIGPNRRLLQVLEAVAGLAGEIDFVFDIVGKVWDPECIDRQCRTLGISERVRLHGYLPEAELDGLLARAHLVFNLRHPTMGEASGSQLRIWNAAAASAVSDEGWYGELPCASVFHIPHDGERAALEGLLRQLADDRAIGQSRGRAGHQRLQTHHDPGSYADGLVEIATAFGRDARDALVARAARRLVRTRPKQGDGLVRDRLAALLS